MELEHVCKKWGYSILIVLFLVSAVPSVYAARKFSTGFELLNITNGVEFDSTTGSPTLNQTIVRSGNASLYVSANGAAQYAQHSFQSDTVSNISGRFYIYLISAPTADNIGIFGYGDNTPPLNTRVVMNANRTIGVGGATSMVAISTTQIALETWTEIKFIYWDNGNNTMTIFIDGVQAATGTPNDVGNGGLIRIGAMEAATMKILYDDIAINDHSGTNEVNLPSSGKIVHMQPDSAGDNNPPAGTWAEVDEINPDDNKTIVWIKLTTDIGDFNMESSSNAGIGTSDTINLVQVGIRMAAATAASTTHRLRLKSQSGGTILFGTTTTTAVTAFNTHDDVSPKVYKLTSYTDPQAGGAWTPALLDTAQIGVTTTDGTPDLVVSTLWALVEYQAAAGGDTTAPSGNARVRSGLLQIKSGRMQVR